MTTNDLKNLLQKLAAEGTDTVDLGENHLVTKIRSKRRRRGAIVGAAGLATAAVIVVGAVAIVPGLRDQQEQPPVAQSIGLSIGGCDGAVSGLPRSDAALRLTATQKEIAGTGSFASVDFEVTNTTNAPLNLVTGKTADVTVVQQGVVVATPAPVRDSAVPVKLEPGQTYRYKSTVSLRQCGSPSAYTGQPLEPGSYELYANQRFSPTDGGPDIEAQGGPWSVELK